jgi:hypothetical protein
MLLTTGDRDFQLMNREPLTPGAIQTTEPGLLSNSPEASTDYLKQEIVLCDQSPPLESRNVLSSEAMRSSSFAKGG